MLTHPLEVAQAVFDPRRLKVPGNLLFLPLLAPASLLPVALPFLANATSSFPRQATLDGAYAALFVPWVFRAAVHALTRPWLRRLLASGRATALFCTALLAVNVTAWPLRSPVPDLAAAHAGIAQVNRSIEGKSILAQGSVLPHLGWGKRTEVLQERSWEQIEGYDVVLLSEDLNPWPFTGAELRRWRDTLAATPGWSRRRAGCLDIFSREERP